MATSKKTGLTSFRLSPEFRKSVDRLAKAHGAKTLSEYFRGLIYLDALLASEETDSLDKPAWVTKAYGMLIRETENKSVVIREIENEKTLLLGAHKRRNKVD